MKTYWCVASGPSLRFQDLDFLRHRRVIAVNRAHERIPDPYEGHIWFSDWRFWAHYEERLMKRVERWKLHTITDPLRRLFGPRVSVWRNSGLTGLAREPGNVRTGNNSGHAAINLAYHLGARYIVLLGYDMRIAEDGAAHFHEEHPWGNMRARTLEKKMIPYFKSIADDLSSEGVTVINCTPDSALPYFNRQPLSIVQQVLNDPL